MKHFTLLMATIIAGALTASASQVKSHKTLTAMPQAKSISAKASHTPTQALKGFNFNEKDLTKIAPSVRNGASRSENPCIYEAQGTSQQYLVNSFGYSVFWGYVFLEPSENLREIVWGEEGEVYIKDPLPVSFNTYVKGTYAEGKVTVELPQVVEYYYEEGDEEAEIISLSLCELREDEDGYLDYYNVASEDNFVTYTVNEDGSLSLDLNPDYDIESEDYPNYILALVGDTTEDVTDWYGYGDALQTFTKFDMEQVEVPADATYESWVMKYSDIYGNANAYYVEIALSGNEIYLGGLSSDFPEGWAKGTIIDGNQVVFESKQYEGYFELYSVPIYFLTAKFSTVYYEEEDYEDIEIEFTDQIVFNYDAENKVLSAAEDDDCIVLNAKLDELYYLSIIVDPEIKWQDPALLNASPVNPECVGYTAWDPDFYDGQGYISWIIPQINVNGALLDSSRMYYHFLVDGEVYAFDPEEYPYIDDYMEDVPYDFTDGYDIWALGEYHEIYFYFDGAQSFGLQSFYVGEDGITYASEIVTYVPETSGINTAVNTSRVVSSRYFDLTGREVTAPANGIYIKSSLLDNGTIQTSKVAIK